jgi:hypothetical protein
MNFPLARRCIKMPLSSKMTIFGGKITVFVQKKYTFLEQDDHS